MRRKLLLTLDRGVGTKTQLPGFLLDVCGKHPFQFLKVSRMSRLRGVNSDGPNGSVEVSTMVTGCGDSR